MKPHSKRTKILVDLNTRGAAARDMLAGIMRYAALHRRLDIQFTHGLSDDPEKTFDHYRDWRPDALIVDSVCHRYRRESFTTLAGRAVVYVSTDPRGDVKVSHASIVSDDETLGKTAADFFGRKNLASFAFAGAAGLSWSARREKAFADTLRSRGIACEALQIGERGWRQTEIQLASWLKSLKPPCGVWAANDMIAKNVIDACRAGGLHIPEQIQILGTDNESYICEHTEPSLSSIELDFEDGGFQAAEFIDITLSVPRTKHTVRRLRFRPKGIVERMSTTDINGTARRVAAAHEFIRRHAGAGISVSDVAVAVGVSTRLLAKNYRMVSGTTVLDDIKTERLAQVRHLLKSTTTPIDRIGEQCGFKSPAHLMTLFKRTFGMTMSEFRRS
jgi:LacI family transcriptional regulator